ncbi:MAG: hypothetical protein ABIH23_24375, partial [bacterium]
MSNSLVEKYRRTMAERGWPDERHDYFIVRDVLGPWAEKDPTLFDKYPDFAKEFREIREANAPSPAGEVLRGLKRGSLGLASTGLGGMSLFTGEGWLREQSRKVGKMAAEPELAPTVRTLEDIGPGEESTWGKVFSRDAVRYAAAKFGEAAPSIGEAVVVAAAGALGGAATAGPVGGIAGGVTGFLGRNLVKTAIKNLVKRGAA